MSTTSPPEFSDQAGSAGTRRTFLKGSVAATVAITTSQATATAKETVAQGAVGKPGTVSQTPFGAPTAATPVPGAAITAVGGDRPAGWSQQTRAEVVARNGVVATSQSVAAQAGLRIMIDGGNSVDAAVATAAVLGLVEPGSAGIGGDMFVLHYSARDRKVFGLNGSGPSPSAWTPDYFRQRGYNADTGMPERGIDSVSVPGAVAGWDALLKRFGSRGFDTVLAPAAKLATEGFGVTERIHRDWTRAVALLAKDPDSARTYLVDGHAPALYSIFRNPDLAKAYRTLQQHGPDAFYRGDIADAILAKSRRLGGALNRADLADFRPEWVDSIHVDYHGYDVHQLPPNTQGFATLIMLNIVERLAPVRGFDLAVIGPRSPMFWHLLVEAKKLAYDELHRHNGDPRFVTVPLDKLLSKDYAAELCKRIDPNRATPPKVRGAVNSGTVYLTTADRWGNMTSFIYSVFEGFGSGVTVPGYGFPLQNRAALFNLDPTSPNIVAPRKRPFHTLIPAFVTKDGRPVLSFGNMGGSEQAQAQATELVNMVNLGMNPQAATDAARFYHDQFDNILQLEPALQALVGPQLAALGHDIRPVDGANMGGYQAIHFTPQQPGHWPASTGDNGPVNGVYRAASDHRKDGSAVGW
ncbi:gamma-glutamyltransferase family protein [Actinocrispum wychmicini]|uniref:Gamma-glutamyltranspeptidase/glutathione hydrolase n=1 Tax=Actinocrispum wychmicini TaxID=1213861 RepID=A0A4V2S614_9PSEU|nr:gamma-glutamyltransferase family protein [Actinocrispum wychmicini]TCO54300.1 gamma-glutamyltranspeptidase/glutathione hydrolase [Actinocrispum wychmicini]